MKRAANTNISPASKFCRYTGTGTPHSDKQIFEALTCYVLPSSFGLGRLKIFTTQIQNYGGKVIESLNGDIFPTHIIVEDSIKTDKVSKLIKDKYLNDAYVVRCTWVSNCVKSKQCLDISQYTLSSPKIKVTKCSTNTITLAPAKEEQKAPLAASTSSYTSPSEIDKDTHLHTTQLSTANNQQSPQINACSNAPTGKFQVCIYIIH